VGFDTVYDVNVLEECAALVLGDGTFRCLKGNIILYYHN
jgi:hypothetical protein